MKLLHDLFDYLKIDFIQLAVLILGVAEVLLARANNIWLYPAGIGSIDWGPCPAPPATCPADVTGDGQVDIQDFLLVLGNWS